jgi:glycine/D-amino acid oxidase-like deaminating enzyme
MSVKNTIAICGAGIAGVATAYYILKLRKDCKVILIDKNQPLSFTTSKSGENFRDYWPEKNMRQFVSDSIELMKELRAEYGEESFEMKNSGYNFISHNIDNPIFGSGDKENSTSYLEEFTNTAAIQKDFPYLDKKIEKVVRIKNAGKIDVYDLGNLLLREAKKMGLVQVEGEILNIEKNESKFKVLLDSKKSIEADKVVIATGPFLNTIAKMFGFEFPISNTLQRKFIIPDPINVIPKNMPFTIYADSQYLDWSTEEKEFFASDEKYKWLLNKFPGGLHIKPETEGIKLGWAFQTEKSEPSFEIPSFEFFPQVVLKGASRFIPELSNYENNIPTPLIEYAGYYTRTKENWPLIGQTEIDNVFVVGALAGYGTMSACAAGKLCANYILGENELPSYAKYFHPSRYKNEAIQREMSELDSDGQL